MSPRTLSEQSDEQLRRNPFIAHPPLVFALVVVPAIIVAVVAPFPTGVIVGVAFAVVVGTLLYLVTRKLHRASFPEN